MEIATVAAVNNAAIDPTPGSEKELRARVDQLTAENRVLELKVQKLQRMLWDKKSERTPRDDKQAVLFNEPGQAKPDQAPASPAKKTASAVRGSKGPRPLDPALPREVIQVPAPDRSKGVTI